MVENVHNTLTGVQKARVYVIIGAIWGDEGKGKVATYYSDNADLVIRATGGANAGHTVFINGKKVAMHLIPGGIGYSNTICLIGQGTVVDFDILSQEIETVRALGVEDVEDRLKISGMANVLFPYHKVMDKVHEWLRTVKVGTTGKGIGPAYCDEASRFGIKVYQLLLPQSELYKKLFEAISVHAPLFYEYEEWWEAQQKEEHTRANYELTPDEMEEAREMFSAPQKIAFQAHKYGFILSKMFVNGDQLVQSYVNKPDAKIVVEGAQSVLLSLKSGHYPMVTSSDANIHGTLSGAHLSYKDVTEVILVTKAYFSKVGAGPFVTEFDSHIDSDGRLIPYEPSEALEGDHYRDDNGEYGATTGRPRRTGAFDAVLLKSSVQKSGADYICINCLDSIGKMGEKYGSIKICHSYEYHGNVINYYPDDIIITGELPTPKYITFGGGWTITEDMNTYDSLPEKAKFFISMVEQLVGCAVKYIGVGPKNEDLIVRSFSA